MKTSPIFVGAALSCALCIPPVRQAHAAGLLVASGASSVPELVDHEVHVVLDNGFARTEVTQRFVNPNDAAVDATYEFPVPKDAALSEMTIMVGERTLSGEVLPRDEAQAVYDAQREAGTQAGLATKNTYQTFQFDVANIPPDGEATMRFVYYEPLAIDTAVGRYVYPLEDGGTRSEAETSFWSRNETITGHFSFDLELKSALPVEEVRMPGLSPTVERLGEGHYRASVEDDQSTLNQDIVFYYRFPDDQPGRVEVVPYRPESGGAGTFMMVVTPGIDLAPLDDGHDTVFVVDVSGSMEGKLQTLVVALDDALRELGPEDRFRVVAFDDQPRDVTGAFQPATMANVEAAVSAIQNLAAGNGTNLYAGLTSGLNGLDQERVAEVVLITDGVANTGIVDPVTYDGLLREKDVRVFGLLLGNNSNWPLMEIIAEASGGFYAPVSNQDDIYGQILLAQSKITHESLHDARLTLSGVDVHDTTDFDFGKVYRGQQLVVFGRYDGPGAAMMHLDTKISGKDHRYETSFDFPAVATDNPELERLWALDRIHAIEHQKLLGLMPDEEAGQAIEDLGVAYQLVTDETAMVVLDDATFDDLGIDRANQERTATEHAAQAVREATPPVDYRVDGDAPAFSRPAPALGGSRSSDGSEDYGGALDPWGLGVGMLALGLYMVARRREVEPRCA